MPGPGSPVRFLFFKREQYLVYCSHKKNKNGLFQSMPGTTEPERAPWAGRIENLWSAWPNDWFQRLFIVILSVRKTLFAAMNSRTYCYPYPHPAVTTDIVLFTILQKRLRVLLIQRADEPFQGSWALPGGFLAIEEDLESGAKRELEEETGISGLYLEQLYTFGAPQRDPRERVISVTYFALVPPHNLSPRAGSDAKRVDWFALEALPPLAFDHEEILRLAHRRLLAKLQYSSLAFQFMPATFTLTELQGVYEILRNEALDKRNFRKWILSLDLIAPTEGLSRSGNHRPARTYRVKHPDRVEIIR